MLSSSVRSAYKREKDRNRNQNDADNEVIHG